jgi:hypothetical protein
MGAHYRLPDITEACAKQCADREKLVIPDWRNRQRRIYPAGWDETAFGEFSCSSARSDIFLPLVNYQTMANREL